MLPQLVPVEVDVLPPRHAAIFHVPAPDGGKSAKNNRNVQCSNAAQQVENVSRLFYLALLKSHFAFWLTAETSKGILEITILFSSFKLWPTY